MNQKGTTTRVVIAGVEGELSGDISIDVSLIPEHARNALARMTLALVEDVFAQPGEEERYQEWLKKRKGA